MNTWVLSLLTLSALALESSDAFSTVQVTRSFTLSTHRRPNWNLAYKLRDDTDVDPGFLTSPLVLSPELVTGQDELLYNDDQSIAMLSPTIHDVTISKFQSDGGGTRKEKPFPLVIKPRQDSSLGLLQSFLRHNKPWLDEQILEYGAVWFRDFDIDTAQDVEDALLAYEPHGLSHEYRGTSPRSAQDGTTFVFSAAEVPSHYPIAQHLDMSFLESLPKNVFFSALKAPKALGGETALSDFRQVFRDISPQLRQKLATKKIQYRRTHHKRGARFTHDVAAMKSWPEVFGTTDKRQVEQIAQRENMPVRWEGRNNDTFVSEYTAEPFQLHPETKDPIWFNHAQVFHWTSFPAELFYSFSLTRDVRFLLRAIYISIKSVIQYGLLGQRMGLDISFGDGTPFTLGEVQVIRRAVHKNMVLNRWQKGDLVLIDNFRTAHGRQPTFDHGRPVVVAWSDPIEKSNEPFAPELLQ